MNNHMLLINLFVETLLNSFGQFFTHILYGFWLAGEWSASQLEAWIENAC